MPFANLAIESSVLCERGWMRAGDCAGSDNLWGIDRHGKWCLERIVTDRGGDEMSVYLGTQRAFGILAASSRIVTRDGTIFSARSIAEESKIGEMWFEVPGAAPEVTLGVGAAAFVEALRASSSLQSKDTFALRRILPQQGRVERTLGNATKTVSSGGSEFCVFEGKSLIQLVSKDWANTVINVCNYCFSDSEGNQTFDRENGALIAWYLSALRTQDDHFRLVYETLQCTRLVTVHKVKDPPSPIARGSCACIGAVVRPIVRISWSTPSWSPVAGGFFLRGS